MEIMEAMGAMQKAYENIRMKKSVLKDLNLQVKEEMANNPRFKAADEELQTAKARMKQIKEEAMESTGNKTEIENVKADIALEQEVLDSMVEFLVAEGKIKSGEEISIGMMKVVPKVRVKFTKQMVLL